MKLVALASNKGHSSYELLAILKIVRGHRPQSLRAWREFSAKFETNDVRVRDVLLSEDELSVALVDGRTIIVPLAWSPRLVEGTPAERTQWEVAGGCYGIHWPELDEDRST